MVMEGKTKQPQKLTYEQLQKVAGDLHQQNQQLIQQIQQMQSALEDRSFNYTSFFLSMLFKVMEHPEMYSDNFVSWASGKIEEALMEFDKAAQAPVEEPKKDEAE